MKKEVSPAITWIAVIVVVAVVAVIGFKVFAGPPPDTDKKAGDKTMERVKSGQPMYTPPPGAVHNGGGGSQMSLPGYNMRPPNQ